MKQKDNEVVHHLINENICNTDTSNNAIKITLFGQFMVLLVSALGIGVAEITQIATSKFKHPLLLRYINTFMLCSMFLPTYIWHKCHLSKQHKSYSAKPYPFTFIKQPLRKLILLSIIGSIFENGGGYFFYLAVTRVTVPTFGALTGLTAVFAFIFSVIFLNEKVILWKVIAVVLSFGGTLFFVFDLSNKHEQSSNSQQTHDTWWGILFTLLVAIMWPANDIIFKIAYNEYFAKHKVIGTFYYTSMMGLVATILFVFVLWIDPLPQHEWKHITVVQIEWIIINGVYLIFIDMIYNITNSLTSPLLINVGNLVSIPFGFVVDMFVHSYKLTIYPIIGTCFIMTGFLMMEILKPPKCAYCSVFGRILYQTNYKHNDVGKAIGST